MKEKCRGQICNLFLTLRNNLKLFNWIMLLSDDCSDSWCDKDNNIIYIKIEERDDVEYYLQMLIHEITHAILPPFGHPKLFWIVFEELLSQNNMKMNKHFIKMKKDYLC